jgi:hypothetical protein
VVDSVHGLPELQQRQLFLLSRSDVERLSDG